MLWVQIQSETIKKTTSIVFAYSTIKPTLFRDATDNNEIANERFKQFTFSIALRLDFFGELISQYMAVEGMQNYFNNGIVASIVSAQNKQSFEDKLKDTNRTSIRTLEKQLEALSQVSCSADTQGVNDKTFLKVM